ncbi:hypothetical protein CcCBS67573_g10147 [Chytriomyces confervae]|uniref:Uncharacterized protein n=1 Tax=Chytriomyces confervae TaxID=246404 RepID=A0A507DEL8_9FUNG|nr:hypothetical protein CcCBS67573_g10147 [Chytriomyces confervae]
MGQLSYSCMACDLVCCQTKASCLTLMRECASCFEFYCVECIDYHTDCCFDDDDDAEGNADLME